MVEFALVLPLLLVIIFICIGTAFLYALRIAEHKAAYDAARYVAKVTNAKLDAGDITGKATDTYPTAQGAAQDVVDFDYQGSGPNRGSAVMKAFGTHPQVTSVKTGPDAGGPAGYHTVESVEVTITYKIQNIPGWDYLAAIYGSSSVNGKDLTEQGVAARVVNQY
ncbi:MAG: TadE/TadG family type IV pilus assembly protein [Candidatus Dormiibacterota bacterium]